MTIYFEKFNCNSVFFTAKIAFIKRFIYLRFIYLSIEVFHWRREFKTTMATSLPDFPPFDMESAATSLGIQ